MNAGSILTHSIKKPDDTGLRISQLPWYLTIVAKHYETLTLDGISVLIPVKVWFGHKYVFIPPFVQRISVDLRNQSTSFDASLVKVLLKEYKSGLICLDHEIDVSDLSVIKKRRINYLLRLEESYSRIASNYNKGHQLNIKKFMRSGYLVRESLDVNDFVQFYSRNARATIPSGYKNPKMMHRLIQACIDRQAGKMLIVKNEKEQLLAAAFFTFYNNRIVYLTSCSNREGRAIYAMHAIIDQLIKDYSASGWILDFEGSMIPGIAYFMKGFGSEEEAYYSYQWGNGGLIGWLRRFRRFFRVIF